MRLWQEQLRTSDLLHAAGFKWNGRAWCKRSWLDARQFTVDFVNEVYDKTLCVNSEPFAGIEPGRLLFTGGGAKRRRDGTWDVSFLLLPAPVNRIPFETKAFHFRPEVMGKV